ncbi:MAG: hypothetical protein ACC645_21505, partial [Pirellulales bacterium]
MHSALSQAIRQRLVAFQRSLPAPPEIDPSVHAGPRQADASPARTADDRPDRFWFERGSFVRPGVRP